MAREAKWKAREVQRDEEIGWGEDHHPSSKVGLVYLKMVNAKRNGRCQRAG
jgi:hypothetical protein